ncbi:MAG: GPR endopeptidase [Defluviitaleaceae bacterium]|nr:GPR endopeptidase [Defluviitaleaceae bacterium]
MRKNIYTDLALEMAEAMEGASTLNMDGIEMETTWHKEDVKITTIKIKNKAGSKALGKPEGEYITIESPEIKVNNAYVHENIIEILTDKLAHLKSELGISNDATVLVIGLGNDNVTPDALGPQVVSKVLVTRHIMDMVPKGLEGLRPLCALAPGVMGTTGIETAEVVKGLVEKTNCDLVIAIDALAARSIGRINQTIQLADTGISPGSGLGNFRKALNHDTLGVPVIAIGVPTVVDAATFVNDTLEIFLKQMAEETPEELRDGAEFFNMLNTLEDADKYAIIRNSLAPHVGDMFVTPKEIGEVVKWLSNMIANAINMAMHKGITKEDMHRFMY